VVAQGLAGTPWYQADQRRSDPGLFVGPLRDAAEWRRFAGLDAPAFATVDCEIPGEAALAGRQRGLVTSWTQPREAPVQEDALWSLMARRGRYEYEDQPDFFTSDLVGNYAQARYQQGRQLYAAGAAPLALAAFRQAWSWQWTFADPAGFLGFAAYSRGDYVQARDYYAFAVRLNENTMRLTEEYHSLPDLKAGVRRATAEILVQMGVVHERLKDVAAAQSCYERSLEIFPTAQAHYDMAVLFWRRDPARAQSELLETVRLDPGHAEANRYLAIIRSRRR